MRAKKIENEKKAKLKAEVTLRAIQFPHPSKMVAPNKEILLANKTVVKWVGGFVGDCASASICQPGNICSVQQWEGGHAVAVLRISPQKQIYGNGKPNTCCGTMANQMRAKEMENEKKAKLKAEVTLRAIQFPHPSKMVAPNKEILLANETVVKWVGVFSGDRASALICQPGDICSVQQWEGGHAVAVLWLFPQKNFMVTAAQTRVVEQLVSVLAGNKLREADVIDCLHAQLDKLNKTNDKKRSKIRNISCALLVCVTNL